MMCAPTNGTKWISLSIWNNNKTSYITLKGPNAMFHSGSRMGTRMRTMRDAFKI